MIINQMQRGEGESELQNEQNLKGKMLWPRSGMIFSGKGREKKLKGNLGSFYLTQ